MAGYAEFLTFTLEHPLIAAAAFSVLPGAGAEGYLARRGLKAAFSGGCLSLRGAIDFPWPPEEKAKEERGPGFYYFCADPYLIRASAWPSYQPGREILFFTANAAGGFDTPEVVEFLPAQEAELGRARKKYQGRPFGPPPFGLFSLPPLLGPEERLELSLTVPVRQVRLIYKIVPRLNLPLVLLGNSVFEKREERDALLFVSQEKFLLAPFKARALSLAVEDGAPVLENLPGPSLAELHWNPEFCDYAATVTVDLSRFGLIG